MLLWLQNFLAGCFELLLPEIVKDSFLWLFSSFVLACKRLLNETRDPSIHKLDKIDKTFHKLAMLDRQKVRTCHKNYTRLERGMTKKEVLLIMGDPDEIYGDETEAVWSYRIRMTGVPLEVHDEDFANLHFDLDGYLKSFKARRKVST